MNKQEVIDLLIAGEACPYNFVCSEKPGHHDCRKCWEGYLGVAEEKKEKKEKEEETPGNPNVTVSLLPTIKHKNMAMPLTVHRCAPAQVPHLFLCRNSESVYIHKEEIPALIEILGKMMEDTE